MQTYISQQPNNTLHRKTAITRKTTTKGRFRNQAVLFQ